MNAPGVTSYYIQNASDFKGAYQIFGEKVYFKAFFNVYFNFQVSVGASSAPKVKGTVSDTKNHFRNKEKVPFNTTCTFFLKILRNFDRNTAFHKISFRGY